MPNLKQLINIKAKYAKTNFAVKSSEVKTIMEAFDPSRLVKAFSYSEPRVKKYIEYFKERKRVEAVLLFIDVTSFSSRFKSKTSDEIANFLDAYYDKVIPTIGEYGGEIEKIIGDGIICVFGEPFLELDSTQLHRKAENCAMKIISDLKDSIYESKVALHFGEIMYYQNKSDEYYEFTMIGNALTELFRLESVSSSNCINFYCTTRYEQINQEDVAPKSNKLVSSSPAWTLCSPEEINLKGVRYTKMRRLQKT